MASSSTQIGDAVADTYARALFDLALKQDALAEVADELADLSRLLEAEPDLAGFFAHRTIAVDRRAASIDAIFSGRISDLTRRFLQVLNHNGRLGALRSIVAAFDQLLKTHRGEIDVEVHTARPLDAGQLDSVAKRIGEALGKTAVIKPRVDESLIGGLRIRLGDRLIDASVRSQLQSIKQQLAQRGNELIRSHAANLLQEG
ncbi:ATP synthase F1 subunit delta [Planctomycetales bacterium ZRK34]|nr:ATP synthase F1 subunit delta [Planctomycetales bacterium ZRK34]